MTAPKPKWGEIGKVFYLELIMLVVRLVISPHPDFIPDIMDKWQIQNQGEGQDGNNEGIHYGLYTSCYG